MSPYRQQTRLEDALDNLGLFGEGHHVVNDDRRVVFGPAPGPAGMRTTNAPPSAAVMTSLGANPTPKPKGWRILPGELCTVRSRPWHRWATTQVQIGLGHTETRPRPLGLISKKAPAASAHSTAWPRADHQLDLGITHRHAPMQAFASAYYNQISDYVLISNRGAQALWRGHPQHFTIARAIDARTVGQRGCSTPSARSGWPNQPGLRERVTPPTTMPWDKCRR